MNQSILYVLFFILTNCTFIIPRSSDPVQLQPNDSFFYYYIDISEMPGGLRQILFNRAGAPGWIETAYDSHFDKSNNKVVGFFPLPPDSAFYISRIQSADTGFMSSGAINNFIFTPQNSIIKIKTGKTRDMKFLGAYKFSFIKNGIFQADNFHLEPCPECVREIDVLKFLISISKEDHSLHLRDSDIQQRIQKRLQIIESKK